LKSGQPAVLRNAFVGQPIREILTSDAAEEKLGSLPIKVMSNYITTGPLAAVQFFSGVGRSPREQITAREQSTVGEYLRLVKRDAKTRLMVGDEEAPPDLLK